MGKKVLVVLQRKSTLGILLAINRACGKNAEVITTPRERALETFIKEMPQIVVVVDYTEKGSLARGFQTYQDIKARLRPWQILMRTGHEKYPHADYIKYPPEGIFAAVEEVQFEKTIKSLLAA